MTRQKNSDEKSSGGACGEGFDRGITSLQLRFSGYATFFLIHRKKSFKNLNKFASNLSKFQSSARGFCLSARLLKVCQCANYLAYSFVPIHRSIV